MGAILLAVEVPGRGQTVPLPTPPYEHPKPRPAAIPFHRVLWVEMYHLSQSLSCRPFVVPAFLSLAFGPTLHARALYGTLAQSAENTPADVGAHGCAVSPHSTCVARPVARATFAFATPFARLRSALLLLFFLMLFFWASQEPQSANAHGGPGIGRNWSGRSENEFIDALIGAIVPRRRAQIDRHLWRHHLDQNPSLEPNAQHCWAVRLQMPHTQLPFLQLMRQAPEFFDLRTAHTPPDQVKPCAAGPSGEAPARFPPC